MIQSCNISVISNFLVLICDPNQCLNDESPAFILNTLVVFIKLSQHLFLFSLCVGEQQVKLGSPDYTDCNTEEAIQDFMKRIKCYENSYQPLDENLDRLEIQFHLFPNVFHPRVNTTSYYLCTL